jgi:hypothetical protein
MYILRVAKFGLVVNIVFSASCAMEPSTTGAISEEQGPSTLDPPIRRAEKAPATVPAPIGEARVPGARQVGYYDMSAFSGQPYEVAPIVAGGGTPITIFDPSAAALTNLNVLWVDNPDNAGFGAGYVARLPDIAAAVQSGMVLVIHDRAVDNAASILPGGAGIGIFRNFDESADINIRDSSTQVTAGLDNASLDGGNFSDHGFASDVTLPAHAKLILSSTSANRIVTFCYPMGQGAVIYSTIPLDFYLQGGGTNPPGDNLRGIYAPNVVKYAAAGACSQRGPRPTPNAQH